MAGPDGEDGGGGGFGLLLPVFEVRGTFVPHLLPAKAAGEASSAATSRIAEVFMSGIVAQNGRVRQAPEMSPPPPA